MRSLLVVFISLGLLSSCTQNQKRFIEVMNEIISDVKNDTEMNRFVELSVVSLTDDLSKILKGQPYEHAYYGF